MENAIALIVSYLIGSISFSYIFTKMIKKVDIREHGSGNAGATNTLRVLGVGPAITVLLLDMLKGIVAVLLASAFTDSELAIVLAGLAVIVGHNWPIFHGFRGGKGVATTIGVLATLTFLPALIGGLIAIGTIAITRYVSLGSLLFMVSTTILTFLLMDVNQYTIYDGCLAGAATILSFWKHRANISRLLKGEESKLGKKKG